MIRPLDLGGLNHRRQVGSTCPAKEPFGRNAPERRVVLTLSFVVRDPKATSPLRQPGQAHALADALASGEICRIVAYLADKQSADRKAWIERKSHLCGASRLIKCAKQAQSCGEPKMGRRKITIGLNASS